MSTLHSICQLTRIGLQSLNVIHDVSEISNAPTRGDEKRIRIFAAVARALALGENACVVGCEMNGVNVATVEKIAGAELLTRIVSTPIVIIEALTRFDNGNLTGWQALEKGLIAPFAAIYRSGADFDRLSWQRLLETPAEDRVLPVFRYEPSSDGEGYVAIFDHYRPVSEEECREAIATDLGVSVWSNGVEIAAEMQVLSGTALKVVRTYQNVINQIFSSQPTPQAPQAPVVVIPAPVTNLVAQTVSQIPLDQIDPFEKEDFLLSLSIIPQALYDDPVFKKHCCPISQVPIRFPVKVHDKVYERDPIRQWIGSHGRDILNQPAALTDIQPARILQRMIDQRLDFYQKEIKKAIEAGILSRPSRGLQRLAEIENPYS